MASGGKSLKEWILPNNNHQGHILCVHKATDAIAYPHWQTFKTIQPRHVSVFDDGTHATFVVSETGDKEYQLTEAMVSFLSKRSPDFAAFVEQFADGPDLKSKPKAMIARAVETAASPKAKQPVVVPFAQQIVDVNLYDLLQKMTPTENDEAKVRQSLLQNSTVKLTKLANSVQMGMITLQSQFVKQSKDYNIVYIGVLPPTSQQKKP